MLASTNAQPRSKGTLGLLLPMPLVTGILHGRVTIIISVLGLATHFDDEKLARHLAVAEEDWVLDILEEGLHRPSFHLAGADNFGRHCPDRH